MQGSRRVLQRRFRTRVDFFCYPSGRYDDAVVAAVKAAGYLGATTTRHGLARAHEAYVLARIRVNAGESGVDLGEKLHALGVSGPRRWHTDSLPAKAAAPMPKAFAWILAAVIVLVLALFGLAIGIALTTQDRPPGALDTDLEGVTVSSETETPKPEPDRRPTPTGDRRCWRPFGGDPRRSLARPTATLGLPARKFTWARGLGQLHRVPAGLLRGHAVRQCAFPGRRSRSTPPPGRALDATGRRTNPSSPAIDGPRVLVASQDGTVTRLSRARVASSGNFGRQRIESSPVVVDGTAYFGSHDGRVFAVVRLGESALGVPDGRAHQLEPVGLGGRVCVTTYAGSFVCRTGGRQGSGRRTSSAMRSATRASTRARPVTASVSTRSRARGRSRLSTPRAEGSLWTAGVGGLGYTTPAVADGRVFAGGFDGRLRAFRATSGDELWSTEVGGRILGAPVVIGPYVFFSTLEKRTYALRVSDGAIAWRLRLGRYSPGIATERTYFLSLNGRLIAVSRSRHG